MPVYKHRNEQLACELREKEAARREAEEPADNHPLSYNVGESCYSKMKIQPVQYSEANGLSFLEGDIVKRLTRWRRPGGKGKEDLLKCRQEIDQLIYFEENGYE